MSKQKILGSGLTECVEREFEQTQLFVEFVSNGFIRDVVVYKVLLRLLVLSVESVHLVNTEKKSKKRLK